MQLLLFNANIILCNDNVEINNFYKFENPIIKLKNFIVTQRINYPFHKAYYSKEHNFKPCNTNLAIQLSLVVSDALKLKSDSYVSPMYLIECLDDTNTNMYNCDNTYESLEKIISDLNKMVSILKTKGAVFLKTREYYVNESGTFNKCQEFDNEIESLKKYPFRIYTYNENLDKELEVIKSILYNKGTLLAVFNAPRSFLYDYKNEGKPYIMDESEKQGYYILRIIGWKTLNDKEYWIFSFTYDESFGIFNYGMIEIKKGKLSFMHVYNDI